MPDRFGKISEDIFRGGKPSVKDLEILKNVYGVERIISLDGSIGNLISPACYKLGLEHIIIPIGGNESGHLTDFLKENILELLSDKPAYIHCRHGKDRTGMAAALYRIKTGWTKEDAFKEALSFDFGKDLNPESKEFYQNVFMNAVDLNNSEDFRHPVQENAHDALIPTPYQKPSNVMGDDIVGSMRDDFNFGDVAPAFNPQQSFQAKDDIKKAPFGEEISNPPPEFKDPYYFMISQEFNRPSEEEIMERKIRKKILRELSSGKTAPEVGVYNNGGGIRGAGPLAGDNAGGGFVQDTSSPGIGGAGAIETGGFLNL